VAENSQNTVLVVASLPDSLLHFRGHLLRSMVARGHKVFATASDNDPLEGSLTEFKPGLDQMGVKFIPIPLARASINPVSDLKTYVALQGLMKQLKPDVVFSYTIKPNIFGSLAASSCNVARIFSLITGVSSGLRTEEEQISRKGRLIASLYKIAMRRNDTVIFQNPDDLELFHKLQIVTNQKTEIINGSGIDLSHYKPEPIPTLPIKFLLIARILADKGIREYVEAARIVQEKYPEAEFQLLGPYDDQKNGISRDEVQNWEREGVISYLGSQKDVRPFLKHCSVFVLPSYREGTPRTILEAMATGRAIITSDAPGCRQTVKSGFNGTLVPIKDPEALAKAMKLYCSDPERIKTQGKNSLTYVQKYDVEDVSKHLLTILGL